MNDTFDWHNQKPVEVDNELLGVIEHAIEKCNGRYTDAMDEVIKFKKEKSGLKGIHLSVFPKDDDKKTDNEDAEIQNIAHGFPMMEKAHAEGHFKDCTVEEL